MHSRSWGINAKGCPAISGGATWLIGSDRLIRERWPEINRKRVLRSADELFQEFGTRRVVRHDGADDGNQLPEITALTDCAERFEPFLRGEALHGSAGEDADLVVTGWHRVFQTCAQLFIELFAGPNPRELDLDVLVRPQSGQGDQIAREIENSDWLAHVQYADLAIPTDRPSLQHKLAGFRNGHEEPPHLRMSDRDWTACGNLLLKDGNHASTGTENIAEPDRNIFRRPVLQRGQQQFCNPLRCAHDVARPHRLVSRNQNKIGDVVLRSQKRDVAGAEDVIFDGLEDMRLHEWYVFESSRMVDG